MLQKIREFWVIISILGIISGVFLIKGVQYFYNKAFSGYSSSLGSSAVDVNSPQTYANPSDIPTNDSLISDDSSQGLFYKFAQQYLNDKPEYQYVSLPYINMEGKVFYKYDADNDTTYFFSRLTNMPPLDGKLLQVWVRSNFESEQYFKLATSEFTIEDDNSISYQVFVGRGDLKSEGDAVVYSYDDSDSDLTAPQSPILTVYF
jgi:hypothetical protein